MRSVVLFELAAFRGPRLVWVASPLRFEVCTYQAFTITSPCSVTRKRVLIMLPSPGLPGRGPGPFREEGARAPGPGPGELPGLVRAFPARGAPRLAPGLPGKRKSGREPPDRVPEISRTLSGPSLARGSPGVATGLVGKANKLTAYCRQDKLIAGFDPETLIARTLRSKQVAIILTLA